MTRGKETANPQRATQTERCRTHRFDISHRVRLGKGCRQPSCAHRFGECTCAQKRSAALARRPAADLGAPPDGDELGCATGSPTSASLACSASALPSMCAIAFSLLAASPGAAVLTFAFAKASAVCASGLAAGGEAFGGTAGYDWAGGGDEAPATGGGGPECCT